MLNDSIYIVPMLVERHINKQAVYRECSMSGGTQENIRSFTSEYSSRSFLAYGVTISPGPRSHVKTSIKIKKKTAEVTTLSQKAKL